MVESKTPPLRITLDTNIANAVADPAQYLGVCPETVSNQLRRAIADGTVQAFVSEASVFFECLSFEDKLAYLRAAGTTDERPTPDPRRLAIFKELSSLGVRLLHAPLIGGERFIDVLPWADDARYSMDERHKRFCAFGRSYDRFKKLKELGEEMLKHQPPVPGDPTVATPTGFKVSLRQLWAVGLEREWLGADETARKTFRKNVEPLLSEVCDELIVASHFAYGNDFFCTADKGKGTGSSSILHHLNRAQLTAKGVHVLDPADLAQRVKPGSK